MNKSDAIAYLMRCADDNGNHWYQGRVWDNPDTCPVCDGSNVSEACCPGSRYGQWTSQCATVTWDYYRRCIRPHVDISDDDSERGWLDQIMSMVVNNNEEIEQGLRDYAIGVSGADIDAMVRGYLECQLWAQHDWEHSEDNEYHECAAGECDHGEKLDMFYSVADVSPEYVETLREEITGIVVTHPLAVRRYLNDPIYGYCDERNGLFGHDYYLTREGHGAGFWDRGLGALGDYLADIAKGMGSADYLSDNGEGVLVP